MSRRPHWDDDLIDAVFRALSHTYRAQGWTGGIGIDLDESVYPLIAAVEDWQIERNKGYMGQHELGIIHTITEVEFDAEKAEAAIARVRELCEAKTQEVAASDPLFGPPCALYVDDILRALDGDSDD